MFEKGSIMNKALLASACLLFFFYPFSGASGQDRNKKNQGDIQKNPDGESEPGKPPDGQDMPGALNIEFEERLNGPGGFNFEVFTDPDPLPVGSKGTLYFLLNIGDGLFITRGKNETFFEPPSKVGPLRIGRVIWPKPAGTYLHPETKKYVYGWKGQVFLKAEISVAPDAKYGPVGLVIKHSHRVLMEKPGMAGILSREPIEMKVNIGPPLPKVDIPSGPDLPPNKETKRPKPGEGKANKAGDREKRGKTKKFEPGKGRMLQGSGDVKKRGDEEGRPPLGQMDFAKGTDSGLFTPLVIMGAFLLLLGVFLLLGKHKGS